MKTIYSILAFTFLSLIVNAQDSEYFYYYNGEKIYLQTDYSRMTIISDGEFLAPVTKSSNPAFVIENKGKSYTRQQVVSVGYKTKTSIPDEYISELQFSKPLTSTEYARTIQNLQEETNVIKILPFFTRLDSKLGISNNIYVKLLKKDDSDKLLELAEKYSMQVLGYNEFMPLWFTLSCGRESSLNSIDAANLFYETGLFESVEPELMYHNLLTSNDQYYLNQWGLKNTGQYCNTSNVDIRTENAWSITTGSSNIRVAVFDQGIEMDHPDLIDNIYGTGYDAETNSSPSIVRGPHGTSCAGIIGAQKDNSVGVSGVAPNSKLISISINLDWNNTPQQLANGFNWAWQNGADIISNSWGGYAPSSVIDNAIINTLSQGRNGKGTVVVFASGNEDNTAIRYPGSHNPNILVVGAISPNGKRKSLTSCDGEYWGSNYGSQLDIVAPGVLIPTTDRRGNNGYNYVTNNSTDPAYSDYSNKDYSRIFNGTSAACPHVSGIAALILSVNPNLTVQQVNDIIESTAQKVGGYNYQTTSGRSNGTWNNEMGYGLVNAYAAVAKAQNIIPLISGPTDVCPGSVVTYTVSNVPAGASVVWSKSKDYLSWVSVSGATATVTSTNTGMSRLQNMVNIQAAVVHNADTIAKLSRSVNTGYAAASIDGARIVNYHQTNTYTSIVPSIGCLPWGTFRWRLDGVLVGTGGSIAIQSVDAGTNPRLSPAARIPALPPGGSIPVSNHTLTLEVLTDAGATLTMSSKAITIYGGYSVRSVYTSYAAQNQGLNISYTNPVSSDLIVGFEKSLPETAVYPMANQGKTIEVILYDGYGQVLHSAVSSGESIRFDTSGLQDGLYYLHVTDKDNANTEPIRKTIIIKH